MNYRIFRSAFFILPFLLLLVPGRFVFAAAATDSDGDGLSDYDEIHIYHTDPNNPDTDGDGYSDGDEIAHGYSPLVGDNKKLSEVDTDHDGLNDAEELALGTDLGNPDTDGDGYSDGIEVAHGFNPLKGDRDRSLPRTATVDLSTQRLFYSMAGVSVGSIPVSTGVLGMVTPTGTFSIFKKIPVKRYVGPGYNLPNTKWNLEFLPGYYLHGAYWHNQFGIRPMSHGCVNISTANAAKLYSFMDVGDSVQVVGVTPRKALARK